MISSIKNNERNQWTEILLSQNRDRNSKNWSPRPQVLVIESDQKSESGSELDQTNEQPKLHVEFTEAEIISTDTNTIAFKVKFNDPYKGMPWNDLFELGF